MVPFHLARCLSGYFKDHCSLHNPAPLTWCGQLPHFQMCVMNSLKRPHTTVMEPQYPKRSLSDRWLEGQTETSDTTVRRCSEGPGAWHRGEKAWAGNFLQFPRLGGVGVRGEVLTLKVWKEARARVPSKKLLLGLHYRLRNTDTGWLLPPGMNRH